MASKSIPPGRGRGEKGYCVRFEGSMHGASHADDTAHTVSPVPLKGIDGIPVFAEPSDPYKLCGVRAFDSSGLRMAPCFFERFYATVGDMRVSLYDTVLSPPVAEGRETNPWRKAPTPVWAAH